MKDREQFIENIYAKKEARDRSIRKRIVAASGGMLALVLVVTALTLAPEKAGNSPKPQTNGPIIPTHQYDGALAGDSTEVSEPEKEPLAFLSEDEELMEYIQSPGTVALTAPIDKGELEEFIKEKEESDGKFRVVNTYGIIPLSEVSYGGKAFTEIFEVGAYGYRFKDDNHPAYNRYIDAFVAWRGSDDCHKIYKELGEKALGGDSYAEKLIMMETKDMFYELVWSKEQSEAELEALEAETEQYHEIWSVYNEKAEEVLRTELKDDLEKLVSDGIGLCCTTLNGETVLVGVVPAEQCEQMNEFLENSSLVCRLIYLNPSSFQVNDDGESVTIVTVTSEAK